MSKWANWKNYNWSEIKREMIKPVRIQRKRTKGYNMQEHSKSINGLECVYVGRPSMYGNPFVETVWTSKAEVVERYGEYLHNHPQLKHHIFMRLLNKNIACWCPEGAHCHGDVIVEYINNIRDRFKKRA